MTAASAGTAPAQSLVNGALSGTVRDPSGALLHEVSVTLIDGTSGMRSTVLTRRDGSFAFPLLLPAAYDLLVERFGYRPRMMLRIPVRAGAAMTLTFQLEQARPGVGVDSVLFAGAPTGGMQLALQGGGADDDFAALAGPGPLMPAAGGLIPGADDQLGATGLPGRLGAIAVDGVTRWSARHPRVPGAELDGIAFPFAAVRGVELQPGGTDVEWPGAGGGVLSAFTVPGRRKIGGVATLAGAAEGVIGSLVVGGALVPDTAHFSLGVAGIRLAPERPAPWTDPSAAAVVAIARDSNPPGEDLSAYRRAYDVTSTIVSGFGRFDGQVARGHRVAVRAAAATATIDNPELGPGMAPAIGTRTRARDISAGAALMSVFARDVGSELRLSVDISERRDDGAGLVGTRYTDGGFGAGTSDLQPGVFKRTTIRGSETLHFRLGPVGFKGGLAIAVTTHDQTYADGRAGVYTFGDSTGFAARTGAFRQTVGSIPLAHFSTLSAGVFAQAMLRPTPGFEVIGALRYDREQWPVEDLLLNAAWLQATGIDNRLTPKSRGRLAPRLAFTWGLGAGQRWQVHGETGVFAEPLDPGVFAEAVTHATGASVRRAFGSLGAWPAVPDSTVAPVRGQTLTLLGPRFEPPRTARAGFGITGNLGGLLLRLQGDYRHTDFLPVRRDLNLTSDPTDRDQFGRPLYGTLVKSATLLGVQPGSNRRFTGFDEVSTLDPVGASDYVGFTLGLERAVTRGLALMASYTYSRTDDNWFGARGAGAEAQFVPFTDSTGRSTWAEGRSDFDVPHRLVLGVELRLGGRAAPRLAALYRRRSGYPFTPGFRDGVDANGDGSALNDPAFVTDTVAGAAALVGVTGCLRAQIGAFAERNSCRDPAVSALDLRLAVTVVRFGEHAADLTIDAFDVVSAGRDLYDHALYLVDAAGSLTTGAGGVTTVPLAANPNFGRTLVRRDPGTTVRAGLRVTF